MEQVVARENMLLALKRVKQNKGAPGVDGMTVEALPGFLRESWPGIRQQLLEGTYKPQPVRRVEIPKPGGGVRLLGIPTVLDRLIQQALLQVLMPIYDPTFSAASYGFRPRRRAQDAVRMARLYIEAGFDWVVDLDLEKFFDRVHHDILMSRIARRICDKRVLRLIRRYLQAGVLVNGVVIVREEGTPQGGPLSPLLANILLDDLDKELEERGHRFVRYADDVNIYVRSQRAGERVMAGVTAFLERKLRLKVNREKSAVDRPWKRKFLGFSFYRSRQGVRVRLAPETLKRLKDKLRVLTSRTWGIRMEERIARINTYLGGWLNYFALADMKKILHEVDQWLRRRLRMCLWKQWKRVRTRLRELRSLGVPEWVAHMVANSRRGPWFMARNLNNALGTAYWQAQGLMSLSERYEVLR